MQHGDKAFFTLAATDVYTGHTSADFKYGDVQTGRRSTFMQQLARSASVSLPGWPLRLFLMLNAKLLLPWAYISITTAQASHLAVV